MIGLADLAPGQQLNGVIPGESVTVLAVDRHGDAVELTYRTGAGALGQQVLYLADEARLGQAAARRRPFDADGAHFKLAAEAQRITNAGMFDPMLAVSTSDVRPLPHQIRAVYEDLLGGNPLRFLLADDPGAGKTIMAGLFIKELIVRDDVKRCLVVAPGSLVEQWQDELALKFGLDFSILTSQLAQASLKSVFETHPLLIARMDQLSRNDELLAQLTESEWDLVIVDEAHRMGAHYFGTEIKKTKRFQLGELLGGLTRHLLLMTATPHSGKEEDFQLFLTLLDRDQFEGKFVKSAHSRDTSGVMRRMIKEELLTFEGTPLFPERVAETVPYDLTDAELELYEQVTRYVREGMNRAAKLDTQRRNTIGFALTVLQRRLASSPEAIHQSLIRRAQRLQAHRQGLLDGTWVEQVAASPAACEGFDDDEHLADEVEQIEEELVDAATAARTVAELDTELAELAELTALAKQVRDSGLDRKWVQLRGLLESHALDRDEAGRRRKLIVFTEHRDTLHYLARRIGTLLARADAVHTIHGGVHRSERRRITEEFTHNPDCQVLVATDAAGEGLNLQAAHLMVNYDLPWNPNRIEQRFGRIHRIGQTEVCRLWNLVARNTREGAVFERLLEKVEEQRKAFGGKVFDVLGQAFDDVPLRDLLLEAIRYGDLPQTRARMGAVIDAQISEGLPQLIAERSLTHDTLARADVAALRRQMDQARARRLQPHYIEQAFRQAFTTLGGRMSRREAGRFEITHVPAVLRGAGRAVASKYERVTFELERTHPDGMPRAELLAPGHPLLDAALAEVLTRFGSTLERGTVLISQEVTEPTMLVGVAEEILDATGGPPVARRFGYSLVDATGVVRDGGPAPYLDCVAAPDTDAVRAARELDWPAQVEAAARSWIIEQRLPAYLEQVRARRLPMLERVRDNVEYRLNDQINRLNADAMVAQAAEDRGARRRQSSESLCRRAAELEGRLQRRMALVDKQRALSTRPPRVTACALVLPLSYAAPPPPGVGDKAAAEVAGLPPEHAVQTAEVERRAVDAVLAAERALGRVPVEQPHNNPGFDILSEVPTETGDADPVRIEVKGRVAGAEDFWVTHTEVMTGKNAAPRYRLALVRVDPRGPEHDEVRYVEDPFRRTDLGDLDTAGVLVKWRATWAKGREPH